VLAMVVTVSENQNLRSALRKILLVPLSAGATPAVRQLDPDPRISGAPIFIENGHVLLYSITENGVDNLWYQPIHGTGHQITNFSSEQIRHYELLPDGDNLLLVRQRRHSDVVILRDTGAAPRQAL